MTKNEMNQEIQTIICAIIDKEVLWEAKLALADSIVEKYGTNATQQLCDLLENEDGHVRNAAALALKEIKDSSATKALIDAIKKPENRKDRSTLVYALSSLDCSAYFSEVLELTLSPNPDVCWSACDVFFEQGFYVSDEIVESAFKTVNAADINPELKEKLLERLSDFTAQNSEE